MRIPSPESRSRFGWTVLRVALAGIIAAHGWARFFAGGVAPFGGWLSSQGFPLGTPIAQGITAFEIVGSLVLLAGRFVFPLSLAYAFLYAMGLALVHAKEGWFVVGLGRNGAEYSALLITCLLCVGLQHLESKKKDAAP